LTESDEEAFLSCESPAEQEDFVFELLYSKGWARVRVVDEDIYINVARSVRTDRFLTKVAQVIVDAGVPHDSVVYVEILEDSGQYSNSSESLSSLITNSFSSYTSLYSGDRKRILSAGTRSVVEIIEKRLCSMHPEVVWNLKEAVPLDEGWYRLVYLSVNKSDVNNYNVKFSKKTYMARKNPDSIWEFLEEE